MTSVSGKIDPVVRRITAADIAEALGQGLRDFQAVPLYGWPSARYMHWAAS